MVYFDNSATTVCCEEAIDQMSIILRDNYGNPSSLHKFGINAEQTLRSSRHTIADILGVNDDEIIFTSGGTQANNLLLIGAALSKQKQGNKIIATSVEHPSVINALKFLESIGFEIYWLDPNDNHNVTPEAFASLVDEKTILVSCMLVNNELGTVFPLKEISNSVKMVNRNVLVHCDAVQAFGKLPINVNYLNVDMLSASGHKIHGPKGAGFAFVKKSIKLKPINFGGGQEKELFNGTQNLPGIAGFATAAEIAYDSLENNAKHIKGLNYNLRAGLTKLGGIIINSDENCLPYVINFSIPGLKSEVLLNFLSSKDIYVSSGSACSKGKKSYVLKNFGFEDSIIDSAIRVSFSKYNTENDVELLIGALSEAQKLIRKVR